MTNILCFIGFHYWKENPDGIRVCKWCFTIHPDDWAKVIALKVVL